MKNLLFFVVLLLISHCKSQVTVNVNWEEYIKESDPIWLFEAADKSTWYKKWYDAPFVGNGNLGILTYLNNSDNAVMRIDIGRADVWDHRMKGSELATGNPEVDRFRLAVGYFYIRTLGDLVSGNARINLYDAQIEGYLKTTKGEVWYKIYTDSLHHVFVIDMKSSGEEKQVVIEYHPRPDHLPRPTSGYKFNPDAVCKNEIREEKNYYYCDKVMLAGGDFAMVMTNISHNEHHITHYVTIDNAVTWNQIREIDAIEGGIKILQDYINNDVDREYEAHKQWWHDYYKKSLITISHKQTESFWWIQMYKVASATRCQSDDNCWAYDLIGPWYTEVYWSDYHMDLNVQMAAWPLWGANHAEEFLSFLHFMDKNKDAMVESVEEKYREDSGAFGTELGWDWRIDKQSWGTAGEIVKPQAWVITGNLNWVCQILWTDYLYTHNETLLRDVLYPSLKRATNFYYHYLTKDSEGKYHFPTTFSPEYANCEDTNWDLSIIRWSCTILPKVIDLLRVQDAVMIDRCKDMTENLTPYPEDEKEGYLIGKDTRLGSEHRHWSHIFMVYPFKLQTYTANPELADVMTKTIDHWAHYGVTDIGFSIVMASVFYQLMPGRDELAWETLQEAWTCHRVGLATFYWEASESPVNESPFGMAFALQYMLLRGDEGYVHIFPTRPKALENATFYQLQAEGGFSVSAHIELNITNWISITSKFGSALQIRVDDLTSEFDFTPSTIKVTHVKDGYWDIDLAKDQTINIYPKGTAPKIEINPIAGDPKTLHAWGTKNKPYPIPDPPTPDDTPEPTTQKPTTVPPTTIPPTIKPTTPEPTIKPTTPIPTTEKPTTVKPTTEKPTTVKPTTEKPTTIKPTTEKPTTVKPTTTSSPTTSSPTIIPTSTDAPIPTTEDPTSHNNNHHSSNSTGIAIGVGCGAAVVVLLCCCICCRMRRKRVVGGGDDDLMYSQL